MKRRSKSVGKLKKRPRKAPKPKRSNAPKATSSAFAALAGEVTEVARLTRELNEALERQAATSEVLQVISGSPGHLEPVFVAMVEKAVRICDALFGNIYRWDGDAFALVATHNTPPAFAEARKRSPVRPQPSSIYGRVVATKAVVHVLDTAERRELERDNPALVEAIGLGGVRSALAVPMLKESELVGLFVLSRQETRPFTEKQIALVTNFAAQAVIAIENARLLNELRQSLQQQTATADVLKIISRSTFELDTVLSTLVDTAAQLCEADVAGIHSLMGFTFRYAASYGMTADADEFMRTVQFEPGRGTLVGRTALEGKVVQIHDVLDDPNYSLNDLVRKLGIRTMLGVPLLRDSDRRSRIAPY